MMHKVNLVGNNVKSLSEILRPTWGSEQWIQEGWDRISAQEQQLIQARVDELFKDGLPLELKHDKILYIYAFSLLAQLEVLAIQVPLKFENKMSTPEYRALMHEQLLDEIFHGIVFTKILFLLCSPGSIPPEYNDSIEELCNFIRNEDCPRVALMLLNLIGEGWIEEIFYILEKYNIAPKVFKVIIDDEHRHVCEADLYRDIGLPDKEIVRKKLAFLETQLLSNVFMQYKYMYSTRCLLGVNGAIDFIQSLNRKHLKQLKKIDLEPSEQWHFFMKFAQEIIPRIEYYSRGGAVYEVPMTPIRKVFMTQWKEPSDPTMVGQFSINVSCIDFFNKKYPPETVTMLMLQTLSLGFSENDSFRSFLNHNKLYQTKEAYTGLVVKLPGCGDHMGTIVFENCHLFTVQELAAKVKNIIALMTYCFKKREYLDMVYPHLTAIVDDKLYEFANDFYQSPVSGNPVVSLSNIGFCGYSQCKSPLRSSEAMKFTIMEIERRPIWNHQTQAFEPQDMLPVTISADHRIFDGNLPVPKITARYFERVFTKMIEDFGASSTSHKFINDSQLIKSLDHLIANHLEMGYKALLFLQTYWLEFFSLEDILNPEMLERVTATVEQ